MNAMASGRVGPGDGWGEVIAVEIAASRSVAAWARLDVAHAALFLHSDEAGFIRVSLRWTAAKG